MAPDLSRDDLPVREEPRCIVCGGPLNRGGECFDCTYGNEEVRDAAAWPECDRDA